MTSAAALRCCDVSLFQRSANLLFGSPSIRRAQGCADAAYTPKKLRGLAWRTKHGASRIYAVDRCQHEAGEGLPRIWISEPVEGNSWVRLFVASYPQGRDRGGWRALELAEIYYAEALGLSAAHQRTRRVDCFRAAEILLLHAAYRGNMAAHCRLGIIYRDDLCEGLYWDGLAQCRSLHRKDTSLEKRAYAHFAYGAHHGQSECCWQLGDMVAQGKGCKASPERAFGLYRQAWDLERESTTEDRAVSGNAALRLARAFEQGRGCNQDFRRARSWYRLAAISLSAAFGEGQWHFKRERIEARRGVARMAQEMAGCY